MASKNHQMVAKGNLHHDFNVHTAFKQLVQKHSAHYGNMMKQNSAYLLAW